MTANEFLAGFIDNLNQAPLTPCGGYYNAALMDDGVAVYWTGYADTDVIYSAVFNMDGSAVTGWTPLVVTDEMTWVTENGQIDVWHEIQYNLIRFSEFDENGVSAESFSPYHDEAGYTVLPMEAMTEGFQIFDPTMNLVYGSTHADVVDGTSDDDFVAGVNGDDDLAGRGGDDMIFGGAGDDELNGGRGEDSLAGGSGDDTYVTDGQDIINEERTGGEDTVVSSVSITLDDNLENLSLSGKSDTNGTGNSLANAISGNAYDNLLAGGRGDDDLSGGGGNDRLQGGAGADMLVAGAGRDVMTGGAGADSFVFDTAMSAANRDTITDYNVAADTIRLENAIFRGMADGALSGAAFASNTSGNAGDRSDRVIYETDTGKLYFDRDGTGSAAKVHVATLDKNLGLTHADFFVI